MKLSISLVVALLVTGCASLEPDPGAAPQPPGYTRYSPPPPPRQVRVEPPTGFATFGLHYVAPEDDVEEFLDDAVGLSFGVGGFLLREGQVGLGPEVEGLFSYHDAKLAPGVHDDVDVARILLGGRLAYFVRDTNLGPYVRGGWMYRWDDGRFIEDDGGGYYVGTGLDIMVNPHFSIVPQFLYTQANLSVDAAEYVFGVNLDFNF